MQPDKRERTFDDFTPFIEHCVKTWVADKSIWDDCRQEGRIIAWKIVTTRPDVNSAYICTAIVNRIRNIAFYGQITGLTNPSGKARDPLRRNYASMNQMTEDTGTEFVSPQSVDPQSDEKLAALAVREAVRTLPEKQRNHVFKVFYLGYSHRQTGPIHRRWYPARDTLRSVLQDLAA